MLDEVLEYQQYSYNINNPEEQVRRLKRSTLICLNQDKNNKNKRIITLTGLNRVLTIIGRHFLFDVYDGDAQLKEKTINALKSWLGHRKPDDTAAEEVHALYNWLPLYVEKVLLAESVDRLYDFINASNLTDYDRSDLDAIITQLSSRESQLERVQLATQLMAKCEQLRIIPGNDRVDRSVLNCEEFIYQLHNRKSFNISGYEDFGEANTVNAITYDRILGNARRAGNLKKYYMACGRPQIDNVRMESGRKLKETDRDIVFKLTAYCMMELSKKGMRKTSKTKSIAANETDYKNWFINEKCDKKKQQSFLYKNERIFEDPSILGVDNQQTEKKGSNTKWIKVNQQWINDSEFEILIDTPETDVVGDFLKSHPGGCVFIDRGTGVPMDIEYS